MDSFEVLVGKLLEEDGYWVRSNYKVKLDKLEKKKIGRPTFPRLDLDLIAYKAKTNELLVVECKSFLDSRGVTIGGLDGSHPRAAKLYKLFNDSDLREAIFNQLIIQLKSLIPCRKPSITLCLAVGKMAKSDEEKIKEFFKKKNWKLFDNEWFYEKLRRLSESGYENDVVSVVSKIIFRKRSMHQ